MVHLSQRAQAISESLTLAISAKANALRLQGVDVVSFGAGEPDFDTPEAVRHEAHEAIQEGFTRYTPVSGILPLKQAIASHVSSDHGASYSPSEVVVGAGAKQCLYNLFQVALDPGDEVLIPTPYWTSYPEQVQLAGGTPVFVPTGPSFIPEVGEFQQRITDKTRVLVINSPSNPTGCIYSEDQLAPIAELARERNLLVVSDEIYAHLIYGDRRHVSIVTQCGLREQGVIISGVSKTYAMTGWRIGYAIGPAEIIGAMGRIQSHSTSCPNSIAQRAALAALSAPLGPIVEPMLREFDKRRMYMVSRLKDISGIAVEEPAGAFYTFPRVSKFYGKQGFGRTISDSTSFAQALLESHNVAAVPGIAFGADDYLRFSYAVSLDEIESGLDRFEDFLAGLR